MSLHSAYATEANQPTVRGRAVSLYLSGLSSCQIAAELGRTTTPGSIRDHLRAAGLGGVHWCPLCHVMEAV